MATKSLQLLPWSVDRMLTMCSPGAPSAQWGAAMYVITQVHVPDGSTEQYGWHEYPPSLRVRPFGIHRESTTGSAAPGGGGGTLDASYAITLYLPPHVSLEFPVHATSHSDMGARALAFVTASPHAH